MKPPKPLKAAILGATGAVGQRFVSLLSGHPWIEVSRVAASERSMGRPYGEACRWLLPTPMPQETGGLYVDDVSETGDVDLAFSALNAGMAGDVELSWARAGIPVFSNARNYRMHPAVPLMIPEVNPGHLDLVATQPEALGIPDTGFIITNANCSSTFLTMVLAPIHRAFGIECVSVVTMQALSGAGYPGLSSMDTTANLIPHIAGEEEKLETEPQKILGHFIDGRIESAGFPISAQVNRVPVLDGHTESISMKLQTPAPLEEVEAALTDFQGPPQADGLPTAPSAPIVVLRERDRPQPRVDVLRDGGMAAMVGGLRPCSVLDVKMTVLGHNTVRGAAGGSILNAELAWVRGLLRGPR